MPLVHSLFYYLCLRTLVSGIIIVGRFPRFLFATSYSKLYPAASPQLCNKLSTENTAVSNTRIQWISFCYLALFELLSLQTKAEE